MWNRIVLSIACMGIPLAAQQAAVPDGSHGAGVSGDRVLAAAPGIEAVFDERGAKLLPALGSKADTDQFLRLEALSLGREGAAGIPLQPAQPTAESERVIYRRAETVDEIYTTSQSGIEQSFLLREPVPGTGDLVVRCGLSGPLSEYARSTEANGVAFEGPFGGLQLGAVTGIDAAGKRQAGSLVVVEGTLELRLPASFVDVAQYPLLIDPLVSALFDISTQVWDDMEADLAYDATSGNYLVVWRRMLSATNRVVRGQLFDKNGGPVSPILFFDSSTSRAERPAIANANTTNRFLVSWIEREASGDSIVAQSVDSLQQSISQRSTFVVGVAGSLSDVDLGGDMLGDQVTLVWRVSGTGSDGLFGGLVEVPDGAPNLLQNFTIEAGSTFLVFDDPVITRTSGYGVSVIAYRRYEVLGAANWDIWAAPYDRDGNRLSPAVKVTSTAASEGPPKVDGAWFLNTANYSLVYERPVAGGTEELILTALDYDNGALSIGPSAIVHAGGLSKIEDYDVAWTPGRSSVTWATGPSTPLSFTVRLQDFDAINALSLGPSEIVVSPRVATVDLAIASMTSGGAAGTGEGLVTVSYPTPSAQGNIYGHLFDAFPPTGTTLNMGGGCGLGGNLSTHGDPAIGNGFFAFSLFGADPSARVSILNISGQANAISCGTCAWIPFKTIYVRPLTGGATSHHMQIPNSVGLVGTVVDAQWTTPTPASSPCSSFANISVSNRLRLVIGS